MKFNIETDNLLIESGSHFWCDGCLVAVPVDDISQDPRYCQGCFEVLTEEAQMLRAAGNHKRPDWWPAVQGDRLKKGTSLTTDSLSKAPRNRLYCVIVSGNNEKDKGR